MYAELHCDECNEIEHTHIDCPVCKTKYAETGNFGDISRDDIINCENCGAQFKLVSGTFYYKDCMVQLVNEEEIRKTGKYELNNLQENIKANV
jgi:hypothetical protein